MENVIVKCYQNLANGIILQAAEDYIWALGSYRKRRRQSFCAGIIKDIEEFFLSEYFLILTDSDGRYLIAEIRRVCGHNE